MYATQADLELAVGGADVLLQLSRCDTTSDPAYAAFVADCLESSASDLNSAIQVKHDVSQLRPPYERSLVNHCAALAAEYAWIKGARGEAMPAQLAVMAERARNWAEQVAQGTRTLGASPQRALSQPVGVIDWDPHGRGISVAGFRRGFR